MAAVTIRDAQEMTCMELRVVTVNYWSITGQVEVKLRYELVKNKFRSNMYPNLNPNSGQIGVELRLSWGTS